MTNTVGVVGMLPMAVVFVAFWFLVTMAVQLVNDLVRHERWGWTESFAFCVCVLAIIKCLRMFFDAGL